MFPTWYLRNGTINTYLSKFTSEGMSCGCQVETRKKYRRMESQLAVRYVASPYPTCQVRSITEQLMRNILMHHPEFQST